MEAGSVRRLRIKRGKAVKITVPCVIILPADCQLRSCILDAIMLGDGEVEFLTISGDDRQKPR